MNDFKIKVVSMSLRCPKIYKGQLLCLEWELYRWLLTLEMWTWRNAEHEAISLQTAGRSQATDNNQQFSDDTILSEQSNFL